MIKKRNKEAFIAFKEALKFKFGLSVFTFYLVTFFLKHIWIINQNFQSTALSVFI